MNENIYYVYLLRGLDKKLIGFSLSDWEIKSIHEKKLESENPIRENIYSTFQYCTERINDIFFYDQLDENDCFVDNPCYIYLEKGVPVPPNADSRDIEYIVSTIRLFNTNSFGTVCHFTYSPDGAALIRHDSDYVSYEYNFDVPYFTISDDEKNEVQELYQKIKTFYSLQQQKSDDKTFKHIKHMLDLFHEAYRTKNPEIAFIMRVTILEMLINGNSNITKRLSNNLAILLGKNIKESTDICENFKKIYKARSEFLHNGENKKITSELKLLALDYSRRMIANLINITLDIQAQEDKKQKSKKKSLDWILKAIRSELESKNFGDNPFNVKF